MENKKLTAVEYIEKTIKHMLYNGGDLGEDAPALMKHIEQAKKIEKDQIAEAFNNSYWFIDGIEYYEKTYGK